jgi:hypothetical protein
MESRRGRDELRARGLTSPLGETWGNWGSFFSDRRPLGFHRQSISIPSCSCICFCVCAPRLTRILSGGNRYEESDEEASEGSAEEEDEEEEENEEAASESPIPPFQNEQSKNPDH